MYPNWSKNWWKTPQGAALALLAGEIVLLGLLLLTLPQLVKAETDSPTAVTCNYYVPTHTNCVVLSGTLSSQTWYSNTIYVISNTYVPSTSVITIEPGTIIKMYAAYPLPVTTTRAALLVSGTLDIQGGSGTPAIFTSYRDDDYGGDTNGDGIITEPRPGDYLEIRLANNDNTFANAVVRYGYYGLRIFNTQATPITPTVTNVVFDRNFFGLTLDVGHLGDINANITSNTFSYNLYGLGTRHSYTNTQALRGAARPLIADNIFQNHREDVLGFVIPSFPIYLDGTAYPTYSGNQFLSTNRHQAIALGGTFHRSGTLEAVTDSSSARMPYVVYGDIFATATYGTISGTADFRLNLGATMVVPANTVFKFYSSTAVVSTPRYFYISGTVDLQSTGSNDRVVFTSYHDDSFGGDTNNAATAPQIGDWQSVTLFTDTTTVDYTLVRYSNLGVRAYNIANIPLSPEIAYNQFEYNKFGFFAHLKSAYDITALVHHNVFTGNLHGIGTGLEKTGAYPGSAARLNVYDNQFNNQVAFPIYLGGTAFPAYSNNTFSNNQHPAIALNGNFFADGTWELVPGAPQLGTNLPYVVTGTWPLGAIGQLGGSFDNINGVTVGAIYCTGPTPCPDTDTVTVLPNTVFKVDNGRNFLVDSFGNLNILANSAANRIIFTSYRDDTVVGDTNADGSATTPTTGSWNYLNYNADQFQPPVQKVFHHALVRYATQAMRISFNGPPANNFFPEVHNVTFERNVYGTFLYIDKEGDIKSKIHENIYISNTYGLGTGLDAAAPNTGVSRPAFYSNTIQGSSIFPVYLGGTAFPVYTTTGTALENNLLINNRYNAIGLGGLFNCSGSACGGDSVDETGSLNKLFKDGVQLPFVITADLTIGNLATVGILPGSIIKAQPTGCSGGDDGNRCEIKVNGELDVQGTANNPVVFTSFRDDTAGGDTNSDLTATVPSRTDWYGVTLYSNGFQTNYAFDYTVVKYALQGLRVYGAANTINPGVANNRFVENQVGLQLFVAGTGNVESPISNNIFQENNISLLANRLNTGVAGKPVNTLTCNDFYVGITSTQVNSLTVLVPGAALVATNNFWGANTGPRHSSNPSGTGIVVTNVAGSAISLVPFATTACQGSVLNAIQGRVADNNGGLAQVTLRLNNGVTATTSSNGDYSFNGLVNGTYTVQPLLSGYVFSPTERTLTLVSADATGIDFFASAVGSQLYNITGQVRDSNGQPAPNVFVYTTNAGASAYTTSGGYYTLTVPSGTYNVVASLIGYNFWPTSRSVTVVNANVPNQDFFIPWLIFGPFIRR